MLEGDGSGPGEPCDDDFVGHHLGRLGRVGLAGRTGFYLLLVGLVVRIALLGGAGTRQDGNGQAGASGALDAIGDSLLGQAAIVVVAAGFLLFGVARLVGAVRDRTVSRTRRAMTAIQGLFYVALAYVPVAFLAGARQTGSQAQQQRTAAAALRGPLGSEVLAGAGVVVIVVCVQQIRGAVTWQFRDGLDLAGAPPVVRRLCDAAGIVGIVARACVFLPTGVFLIVAAVSSEPRNAYGTDAELLRLSGSGWGEVVLALVCVGLAAFVAYSLLEMRYRRVVSAR